MDYLVPGYVSGTQTIDTIEITHHFFYHNWGENNGQYDSLRQDANYWFYGNKLFNTNRIVYYNLGQDSQ